MADLENFEREIDPEYLTPGTVIGPYEIVDRLGVGGFGAAYQVKRAGRFYALKINRQRLSQMPANEREQHEARVRREFGILVQMEHPNIVRVHALERWPDHDGYWYLVMDFIKGLRLYDWRARASPSLRSICHVIERTALALAEAHSRGAFHRDIKSDNLLVDINGEPMIIDWNIARSRAAVTVTQDHMAIGTHSHFAPEFCRYLDHAEGSEDFHMTPPTELHAMGYVFYELLTGRSPFGEGLSPSASNTGSLNRNLERVIATITTVVPQLPSLINAKVPGALDRIVMRLLEKDPAQRFATGTELAQALQQAAADADESWDQPLDVPPPVSPETDTRGAPKPARRGNSEPEMLPPLSEAAAAVARPDAAGTQPRTPKPAADVARFRPPSVEQLAPPPFQAPPGSTPARASRVVEDDELARAAAQLGERTGSSASWLARNKPLVLIGGLVILLGSVTALTGRGTTEKADTLLAKVQREEKLGALPVAPPEAAKEQPTTMLPPSPALKGIAATRPGQSAEPLARSTPALGQKEPAEREGSRSFRKPPSDAQQIDAEIAAAYGRPTVPPKRGSPAPPPEEAKPTSSSSLQFGRRIVLADAAAANAAFGVQTGARIRAQLDMNLDSRTAASGLTVAKLVRSFITEGRVLFPAGTMLYGDARASGGRFNVRFTRLVLPSKREVPFEGLAYDLEDRKPGLAPARRIAAVQQREGTGERVAKAVGNTLLTTVNGGLAEDASRTAAQTALTAPSNEAVTSSGEALLLDAGADMDVLVVKPF